ncbi:MAG: 2OG-Fe(II) oxygenase [Methylococcales bacterium]
MSTESSDIKAICEKLSHHAWGTSARLFQPDLLFSLFEEANRHETALILCPASIGHNDTKTLSSLRGDSTLWLDDPRCGAAAKRFLAVLDVLRKELNESLMLGLESIEAHYSVYPTGAAYARHRDRFRDDDARILSLVCYLNIDWPDNAGGALRLHLPEGQHDIAPKIGTSVLFLSEEIEHEVMPATQTRYSIAAWFRQREIKLR